MTQAYEVLSDEHLRNMYDGGHQNVVYQQRRQRYTSATSTNPFGGYTDTRFTFVLRFKIATKSMWR